MASENKQYGVLVCPKCGNDSSQKGISYAYLEWTVHMVKGEMAGTVIIEADSEYADVGSGGEIATVTNIPADQEDCAHFHCEACRWNWWEDKDKYFK